jgi:uncharacterized protein YdeI (YjbR/CyaY-like superfamily)
VTSQSRQTKPRHEVTFFKDAAAFRAWLAKNHDGPDELWVGFFKKASGQPSITYAEAVEEALCFGWIDGLRLAIDDEAYTNRFTRRKAASNWSAINLKRVEALTAEGRMQPPGVAAYEARPKKTPYSDEPDSLSAEQEAVFRLNPKAWAFFQAQTPWYRRIASRWVLAAKQEATQQRRLQQLSDDSSNGLWIKPLRSAQPASRRRAGN